MSVTSGFPLMRGIQSWICTLFLLTALPALAQPVNSVGMTRFDAAGLPVTLLYPTSAPAQQVHFGPFQINVAMDATLLPGTYPLVVVSHGSGGSPLADHEVAATLVAAGFVVAQPLHQGDNHLDSAASGAGSWRLRPSEITQLIDALEQAPQWSESLQLERVGVHGMSAGGVGALALAGAQWRMFDLIRHCSQHPEDEAFCFSGAVDPEQRAERQAGFARAMNAPVAYLPESLTAWQGGRTPMSSGDDPRPDQRIVAVTLAVPVAAIFGAESLARISIPVGVVRASGDQLLLPQHHTDHVLRHCTSCQLLADVDAVHSDLLSPLPHEVAEMIALRFPYGALPDPDFDASKRAIAFEQVAAFFTAQLGQP